MGNIYASRELHLIRHAESVCNANRVITGSLDSPLTPLGLEQAKRLAIQLDSQYDIAFHSSLCRTKQTLYTVINHANLNVIKILMDSRLDERSIGVLEGQPQRFIPEYSRGDLDFAPEQGETYRDVTTRVLSFLNDLQIQTFSKALICTHMGPLRIIMGILKEYTSGIEVLSQKFDNGAVIKVPFNKLTDPLFL